MRVRFSPLALAALLGLMGCVRAEPPNVLFLLADDQTYTALGAAGNADIRTPNLDRLAQRGTTFSHAYNMGSWTGAVCLASRAMLNCGRSLWRAERFRHQWGSDSTAAARSWPRRMAARGYRTYFSGKWHVDLAPEAAFDVVGTVRGGMPGDAFDFPAMAAKFADLGGGAPPPATDTAFWPVGYARPYDRGDRRWSPTDTSRAGYWAGGRHWSEVVADEGVRFLAEAAERDEPSFFYLAFNAPHDPRQAPAEYQSLYATAELPLPAAYRETYPDAELTAQGPGVRDEALAPFPRTPHAVRTHTREYYALISHLDAQIGRILDALDERGLADNTYVIFTADHGLALGRHGLLGKQNLYDHSLRAPFLVAGPGIPAGRTIGADVYVQDAMATALELAGAPADPEVEFRSVLPLIHGERPANYPAIYGAYREHQRAIRKDGHKLLVYPRADRVKLFDLTADPDELHDLAADGGGDHRALVRRLATDLQQLQQQLGDTLDLQPTLRPYLAGAAATDQ